MANDHSGSSAGKKRRLSRNNIDEERLALLLAQPTWTPEQAQEVLAAQVGSKLTIAQFATQRGVSAGRIYNWKSKLRSWPSPGHQADTTAADPEKPASILDVRLDLEEPGERFMYDYVQRATQGPEPMWSLLEIRRQGSVLLCVVRWVQWAVETGSYSVVQLDLTEPALRWHDFDTAEAATQALEQRCSVPASLPREASLASIVKVQVRGQEVESQAKPCRPPEETAQAPCITICLPSGVRIQIGSSVPKVLMRTVLRTLGAPSC
jgi:hypothetical protein